MIASGIFFINNEKSIFNVYKTEGGRLGLLYIQENNLSGYWPGLWNFPARKGGRLPL
jgi:hypothetical protein